MGLVHQPVQNRFAGGRIRQERMPLVHGHLAGDGRGSLLVPVVQDLEEILTRWRRKGFQPPVIQL